MPNSIELPPLGPVDPLGRGVLSRRRSERAMRGKIDHDTFLEAYGVDSLSVDRLDHASDEVMAEIGDQTADQRGKQFYGWAVVTVEKAGQKGRAVRETPRLDNPYHADIFLNLPDNSERRDLEKQHANALAACAVYRQRPLIEDKSPV